MDFTLYIYKYMYGWVQCTHACALLFTRGALIGYDTRGPVGLYRPRWLRILAAAAMATTTHE